MAVGLAAVLAAGAGDALAKPWLTTTGNVDGKAGDETVTLDTDGTLVAGTATLTIDIAQHDAVFDDQIDFKVVSLGGKRRGVLVGLPTSEGEDPPNRYRVYRFDKGVLKLVYDEVLGTYGRTPLTFDKKGVARYIEDGWAACMREQAAGKFEHNPARREAKQLTVSFKLNAAGTKLVEVSRKPSGNVMNCDELSACPYVYELTDGQPQLQGEILRDVRGAAAATVQSLPLTSTSGPATIVLAEEKLEVTFLDEIYLEVDGVKVSPRECAADATLAFCTADGAPFVLRFGQTLALTFDAPAGARSLFARGYYIPTPTRPFK